jgi:hypothetical protein
MSAIKSGEMFARSEIDAVEAMETFAREVGTEPTYEAWQAARIEFVNGYVSIKPQAKGDAADKAFQRFKDRLVDRFGITVPKATSEAAVKKAAERKAAEDKLLAKYSDATPTVLRSQLEATYQTLAQNPTSKIANAQAREITKVLRIKTRDADRADRDEIKAWKDSIRDALKTCDDVVKLEAAFEALQ